MVSIAFGSYCYVGPQTILEPPCKLYKGVFSYYPIKIGDHVHIGSNCVIEAATIGSFVEIGNDVVIGSFCVIKDCVQILPGTVVPPFTVIPPFTIFGDSGSMEWSESSKEWMEFRTKQMYHETFQLTKT
jgi:dynactin-5